MEIPIRILQVFGALDRGGSETAIMTIYRNIDRKKVQFDFVVHTNEKCDYEEEIISLGGHIYRFPKYKVLNHIAYQHEWAMFFKIHPEYKIIHGHYFTVSSVYFRVARKYKRTCIAHSHIAKVNGLRGAVIKFFTYPLRYNSDYLFACTKDAGIWLYGEKSVKSHKFHIINNAIDSKLFSFNVHSREKKRVELGIANKYVLGHIGRFANQKNHTFLIDIFYELSKTNDNAVLLLIGEGKLKPEIQHKVRKLEIENKVIFAGVRTDIHEIMQAMDVFVFPSLYEGLGIVAVEAQASGLPCVVSDTIPKEAFITDLIIDIPLKYEVSNWVNKISMYEGFKREDTSKEIIHRGYDISTVSKWIEKFYLEKGSYD